MTNRPLEIYLFHCSNSLDTEALRRSFSESEKGDKLKTISLPCSGKLELIYLLKAFESGADGVVLITCKPGECRYLEGNLRAEKRAEAVNSILEEAGLGKGRITVIQTSGNNDSDNIISEIIKYRDKIRKLLQKKKETV